MSAKPIDKEVLKNEYDKKYLKYKRLANNIKQVIETFLLDGEIEVLNVNCRIKSFSSFCDKIERKGYKRPFKEIEDICGVRIVCYYTSDLEKIAQIINEEFDVLETIDKSSILEPDRFGYRSFHYILALKKDWLKTPNYRGLGDLKVELQVRTILMHAWAGIEHKLAYKKTEHIPDQFKRKLYQLSALFEVADDQFESLRNEKDKYKDQVISEEVKRTGKFEINQHMNLDSLQAFLEFYFPEREKSLEYTIDLLDEIIKYNVSFAELVSGFEKVKDVLPAIETEVFEYEKGECEEDNKWAQVGAVRQILELTNDRYWIDREKEMPEDFIKISREWRKRINK